MIRHEIIIRNDNSNFPYTESSAPSCQMDTLYENLCYAKRHVKGKKAVLLKYSLLNRLIKQPYQRRMIAVAFNSLVTKNNIRLYWRSNFDLYLLQMSNKAINFELYIKAAQCVIEGDDIFRKKGKNVKNNNLYVWYDLEKDYAKLIKNVKRFMNKSNLENSIEIIKPSLEDMCTLNQVKEKERNKKIKVHEEKEYNYLKTTVTLPISPLQLDQLERSLEYVEINQITNEQKRLSDILCK